MGEIKFKVLLRNFASVVAAEKGYIEESDVQSVKLDMVVDTGGSNDSFTSRYS